VEEKPMKLELFPRSLAVRGVAVLASLVAAFSVFSACSEDEDEEGSDMSFFVTSTTQDGNLGGLSGADTICQNLASAAGAGDKTWRAYLSAANNGSPIHAKDRIGTGPWYNAAGALVAQDLTALHQLTGNADLFVTERGEKINGQWNGVAPNQHDIMTGSDSTGTLIMTMNAMNMPVQTTCNDWTSNTLTPGPQVGHTDGMGPMMNTSMPNFTSWNGGHASRGCSTTDLAGSGGAGRIYCFATN
jgi:hypothetical protein